MKYKKIKLEGRWATIYFTTSRKQFIKWYGDEVVAQEGCVGAVDREGCKFYIGVFNGELATLVHELWHLMVCLNEHLSEPQQNYNSESNAFLMAHLFDKLRKGLK